MPSAQPRPRQLRLLEHRVTESAEACRSQTPALPTPPGFLCSAPGSRVLPSSTHLCAPTKHAEESGVRGGGTRVISRKATERSDGCGGSSESLILPRGQTATSTGRQRLRGRPGQSCGCLSKSCCHRAPGQAAQSSAHGGPSTRISAEGKLGWPCSRETHGGRPRGRQAQGCVKV